MKLLLAFDSFKECMSSKLAADSFEVGFKEVMPDARFEKRIMSDGGEGFVDALIYNRGSLREVDVHDPLFDKIKASYGILEENIAAIEMAKASGLELIPKEKRNPMLTSSYGTGELIKDALLNGCKKVLIGIGGSATVDGGCGMAQALGVKFFDKNGEELKTPISGKDLIDIASINTDKLMSECRETEFSVACDVNNPLVGSNGSSAVFGPQKGATVKMIEDLELGLKNLARVIDRDLGVSIANLSGAGAAGGIGGMFFALLSAKLEKGVDIVMDAIGLEESIKSANLIITGEGCIDSQTLGGKTISGIVEKAKLYKKPVLAIGGSIIEKDLPLLNKNGIDACMSLALSASSLEEAIESAPQLMETAGRRTAQLIRCFNKIY